MHTSENGYFDSLSVSPDSKNCAYTHYSPTVDINELPTVHFMVNGEKKGDSVNEAIIDPVWSPDSTKVAALVYNWEGGEGTAEREQSKARIVEYTVSGKTESAGSEYKYVAYGDSSMPLIKGDRVITTNSTPKNSLDGYPVYEVFYSRT